MSRFDATVLSVKKITGLGFLCGLSLCAFAAATVQTDFLPAVASVSAVSELPGLKDVSQVADSAVQLDVHARKHAKSVILLAPTEPISRDLEVVIQTLQKDLTFSDQFDVRIQPVKAMQHVQELQALGGQGFSLVFFFSQPTPDAFEWRLYDVTLALMVQGKKYTKRGNYPIGWGHNLSDMIWPALTGQEGFFSNKIAYSKEVRVPRKKKVTHIYVADYDGSNEQLLVNTPTVTIAPRWNNDPQKPLLFYSEYTNANVRLMVADMHKRTKIASNFDGINMVPSFSKDGKQVVYCASRGDGSCHIYHLANGICKRITRNKGNNVSPTFAEDNKTIYFCSDFQTELPQIFSYDLQTQALERITHDGYCACPNYHPKGGLVYAKRANGAIQLFVYNSKTRTHRQVTHNAGDKDEPSWSSCGNCLYFSSEHAGTSRIALLNLLTNGCHYLTSEKQRCSYPSCSPVYAQVPVVG